MRLGDSDEKDGVEKEYIPRKADANWRAQLGYVTFLAV